MATQIKPFVEEISLAFNPANGKKFFMQKDLKKNQKKGGQADMPKLVDIINSQDAITNGAVLEKLIKDLGITSEAADALRGLARIIEVYKDQFPQDLGAKLAEITPQLVFTAAGEVSDEVKAQLRKEIEKELRKEMTDKDNQITVLSKSVEDLTEKVQETSNELIKERDIRRLNEIKGVFKDKSVLGDLDKNSKMLLALEKMNPEIAKDVQDALTAAGEAAKASMLFAEVGSAGEGDDTEEVGVMKEIETKVTELMQKDTGLSKTKAYEKVLRENPDLYRKWTRSQGHEANH